MGILFIIAIPFALILLPKGIEINIIIMSLFILAFEALTSEIQRHLVAISRFTRANVILFIKSAGWMLPALMLFVIDNSYRSIEFIVIFWMIGLAVGLLVGFPGIKENINSKSQVNIGLLKVYLEKILIVLIGTLAARSLFSVDRIIVEKLIGTEQAGIYGLFVGFAAAFVAILDAGILNRSYPVLMRISDASQYEYNALSKKIEYKIIILTTIALVIYEMTIPLLLSILEKNEYFEFSEIGLILIAAYGIYSLSFPTNCRLYVLGKDKLITVFNLCSLVPLLAIFYLSSVSVDRVSFFIVACSLLHYILRRIAVALFIDK
jgi:O-antigen/teichoic acid export membrane protein